MQVLTELDFQVEPSNEPFATVKKLTAEHFDALVVDCENEQNASLLFKSARNSELNQASLSIAVVEGQTGVAKAFRIGANLVLTKPINVEQSKGTIRVARGLLRKSEASRPAATSARQEQPTQTSVNSPRIPVSPLSSSIPSSFELENEPEPQPEPAEAAFLESIRDPSADLGRSAASAHAQASPWQPLSKPMTAPQPAAPDSDERKELLESLLASAKTVPSVSTSASGAAAAPAKQKSPMIQQTQASEIELPSFASTMEKPRPAISSGSGSSKKVVAAVAVVLVASAIGYFGWTKTHAGAHVDSVQKPSPQAQMVQQPAPSPAAMPTASEPTPGSTSENAPELSATPLESKPGSPSVTKESAVSKPKKSAIASTDASSGEESDVTVSFPNAIVVKKGVVQKPISQPPANEESDSTAPALNLAQSTQADNIAGLVNVSPTVPKAAPQTVKISQGVSQGLLVKKVSPIYPQQAMQMKVQGSVEVAATISKQGNITNLKILSGDPILGRAAVDAVKQWKYKPYYLDNQPVEIQTQITVVFKLP